MKRWLQPIRVLLLYLVVLSIAGTTSRVWGSPGMVFQLGLELLLLFAGYLGMHGLLLKSGTIQKTRWEHQVITCLILFLLFEPELPWYSYLIIGSLTEALQRLLRVPTGPLANPVALACTVLALVGLLYQYTGFFSWYPLWWGVSFAPRLPITADGVSIALALTGPVAGWVMYTYRKHWIITSLLGVFIPLYIVVIQRSPAFILLEGTFAFFALVMVIEPKTSPTMKNQQLLYGGLLAILIVLAMKLHWYETYVMPLVIVNVLFNIYRNKALLFKKVSKPVQPQLSTVVEAPDKPPQA